jgi:acetoin utilization protein AcuC
MHKPVLQNAATDRTGTTPGVVPLSIAPETPGPIYVGSDVYRRAAFGNNHPLNIVRHSAVLDLVEMLGWLSEKTYQASERATVEQLREFHDRDYIDALQYAESEGQVAPEVRERYNIGTLENPVFEGLFERASMTVGGSILAAKLACAGHIVFHPSGGTHHGRPDRASGFCYFNDPVYAINTFLEQGRQKVFYVDLDAHHGDGVEAAFESEPRVMTVSVHEEERWPYSGAAGKSGQARNLPVPKGVNDSELNYLMEEAILPLAEDFSVDAVVICCGADCLAGDPLSGMMLSNVALWQAVDQLIALGQPTVILGGGGYNPWTVTRFWAGVLGRISGEEIPECLPDKAVEFMRSMECDLIDEEDVDEAWLTTMADSPYPGPIRNAVKSVASLVAPGNRSRMKGRKHDLA